MTPTLCLQQPILTETVTFEFLKSLSSKRAKTSKHSPYTSQVSRWQKVSISLSKKEKSLHLYYALFFKRRDGGLKWPPF